MGRAAGDIDISLLHDKELERKFHKLTHKLQAKIAKKALRDSAKRMRPRVAAAAPKDTGRMAKAFRTTKIRSLKKGRVYGFLGIGVNLPSREELGISPGDKWYYPTAIEYGARGKRTHFPARPFIRQTADRYALQEYAQIGKDIGRGIEREARK